MMNCAGMMIGPAGMLMIAGVGLVWVFLLVLVALGMAALIKHLRTPIRRQRVPHVV